MTDPRGRHNRRAVLGLLVSLGAVLAGCGSSDDGPAATSASPAVSTTAPSTLGSSGATTTEEPGTTIDISVTDGLVSGGVQRAVVPVGEMVSIRITSDVAEEVHVHGYDLKRDLSPDTTSEVTFTADIPSIFEVELEQSGLKVLDLQVG